MLDHSEVAKVKERHKDVILQKPNVVGVGTGYKVVKAQRTKELCVVALVTDKVPEAGLAPPALVPRELEGVPTDVVQVGVLRAHQSPTDRWRPAPGGVSIGHYQVTAGTLGCVVRDSTTDDRLILSNNHVLANSNEGSLGDPVLQPGTVDGGWEQNDTIAELERYLPLAFNSGPATCSLAAVYSSIGNLVAEILGSKHRVQAFQYDPDASNRVDAAVARPLRDEDIRDDILEIGVIGGVAPAVLGMAVRKSGRTTGFTLGEVLVLEATVDVRYGERTARFEGQIVTDSMSKPGDSGSLLVARDALLAVGLLFAGSEQATIYNPIQDVLDALEVVL
jgi:hypothetical protein